MADASEAGERAPTPVFDMDAVRGFVERLLILEQRKADVNADLREVYTQAHDQGIPATYLRPLVAERVSPAKRERLEPIRNFITASHESLDAVRV